MGVGSPVSLDYKEARGGQGGCFALAVRGRETAHDDDEYLLPYNNPSRSPGPKLSERRK